MEIIIRNPIMNKIFPSEGEVVAVLDTGFEGFLLVPEEIFRELSLSQLTTDQRRLILANGLSTESVGTFGEVIIPGVGLQFEGFIEAIKGVEEIVVGSELMENLRIILDYCVRRVEIIGCKKP